MRTTAFNILTVASIAGAGMFLLVAGILPAGQACHWDEVAHAIFVAHIYHDLAHGDIVNLLFDIYRQVYWPPVHSVLTGTLFCFTGLSFAAARSISLVLFMIMAWTMVRIAAELQGKAPLTAGLTALVLTLATPALMLYSSMAMLEMPGLWAMVLSLYVYFRLQRPGTPDRSWLLLGLGVTLTYFTKQHYGVLLAIVLLLNELIEHRFNMRRLFCRRYFFAVLPLAVSLMIWFAYPPKFVSAVNSLVTAPWGVEDTYGIEGLLYYPRALITLFGSPAMLLIHCVCAAVCLKFVTDKRVRCLILLTVLLFIIGQLHHNKCARHILPMIPPMILMTSTVAAHLGRAAHRLKMPAAPALSPLVITIIALFALFTGISKYQRPFEQGFMDISSHIIENARGNAPVLILGSMDLHRQNPPMIDWQLIVNLDHFDPPQTGIATASAEAKKLKRALQRFDAPPWLRGMLRPVLERTDLAGESRSIWLGNYPYNFNDRESFDLFFQGIVRKTDYTRVFVVTSLEDSAKFPMAYFSPSLQKAGFAQRSARRMAGYRVDIFSRF